jgi:hypothetical protein
LRYWIGCGAWLREEITIWWTRPAVPSLICACRRRIFGIVPAVESHHHAGADAVELFDAVHRLGMVQADRLLAEDRLALVGHLPEQRHMRLGELAMITLSIAGSSRKSASERAVAPVTAATWAAFSAIGSDTKTRRASSRRAMLRACIWAIRPAPIMASLIISVPSRISGPVRIPRSIG